MSNSHMDQATAQEVERMRLHNTLFRRAMANKPICPPIDLSKPGLAILDICCCNGQWLRDIDELAANGTTTLVGADLNTAMFPKELPHRMSLHKQDFTKPFPEAWANRFDLVHQRYAMPLAGRKPLGPIIEAFCKMVRPGGYLQLVELSAPDHPEYGPAFSLMLKLLRHALDQGGIGQDYLVKLPRALEVHGLDMVRTYEVFVPLGKQCEDPELAEISTRLMSMTARGLVRVCAQWPSLPGVTKEDMIALPDAVENEMTCRGACYRNIVVTGRKPRGSLR